MYPPKLEITGIVGIPEIDEGAPLGIMIFQAAAHQGYPIKPGDIIVVTQKVVSKGEGRTVSLSTIDPSPKAKEISIASGKDSRLIELILSESREIIRRDDSRGIIITETRHGFICANAGIDNSNVPGIDTVSLLPLDPDASANTILANIQREAGFDQIGVIITDTFGRAWRKGQVNFAIGVGGIDPLVDYRGQLDPTDEKLSATVIAVADEIAAVSELVMGKTDAVPAAIVRGYPFKATGAGVSPLLRDKTEDLFR